MFFCSACFNKVSSFFLINLNMVFCLCCTKGMPSVCESGPQWFLNNAEKAVCIHVSLTKNKSSVLTMSFILFVCFQKLSK